MRLAVAAARQGLQIVRDPVVDLPDGGVVGQQRAVAALDLDHVSDAFGQHVQ